MLGDEANTLSTVMAASAESESCGLAENDHAAFVSESARPTEMESSGTLASDASSSWEPPNSLYELLFPHRVQFAELLQRHTAYRTIFELVRRLIGVAPNCAPLFEIWRPALTIYNRLVPNMLNLPLALWGVSAPRKLLGLVMYYSSRGQGCAYCSMHSCVFSLRRGTPSTSLQGIRLSSEESVLARTGYALGSIPCRITEKERWSMREHFSEANEEWFILAVGALLEVVALAALGASCNTVL